jgi:hypothetical protein
MQQKPKLKKGDVLLADPDRHLHPLHNFIHKNTVARFQGLEEHGHISIYDGKNVIESMPHTGIRSIPAEKWKRHFEYTVLRPKSHLKKNIDERLGTLKEHLGKSYSFVDAGVGAARLNGILKKKGFSKKLELHRMTCSALASKPYPEVAQKVDVHEAHLMPVDIKNSGLFKVIKH